MRTKFLIPAVASVAWGACNKEVEFSSRSVDKVDPKIVVDQEFSAGTVGDGRIVYQPLYGLVQETLTLREKPIVASTLRQAERPSHEDVFVQGHDSRPVTEDFTVSTAGKLDLLIVVDNSNSMATEQQNLATRLSALTKHLRNVDWQIGVVTTDNPALRNGGQPIRSTDAAADTDFFDAVNVGTGGSGAEKGIKQAHVALADCDKTTHPWLRAAASLAVLFLSDEEYDEGLFDPSADDLINRMRGCRDVAQLKAYALTWTDACPKDASETEGKKYLKVVDAFSGVADLICQADYRQTLERISLDVSRSVKREFDLQNEPEAGSVTVEVDGQAFTDFEVTGKKLKLKSADGGFLKLKVNYRFDSKPRFDRVKLTTAPAPETVRAYVDDVELDMGRAGYDDATRELFFVDIPADDAKIKVKYRLAGALSKDFDFAAATPAGEVVEVTVDGAAVTGWTMDAATRVLSFADAPRDGAAVAVKVRPEDSLITSYPVPGGQDLERVLEIRAHDESSLEALAVVVDGNELVFDDGEVVDGRIVIVTYVYGDAGTVLTHELANSPIDGTVTVRGSGSEDCVQDVVVNDRLVSFSCDAAELSEVEITYQYVAQRFTSFTVAGGIPAGSTVQVYVDGEAVSAWSQDGDVVWIEEDQLQIDSKVRILATVYGTRQ